MSLFASVATPPLFQSAQSCCPFKLLYCHWVLVVCDDARQHVVAIFKTINLSINGSPPQDVCAHIVLVGLLM